MVADVRIAVLFIFFGLFEFLGDFRRGSCWVLGFVHGV